MATSTIEWTEQTWSPTTGCTKVPPGCRQCYAETMARRLHAMGAPGYENEFKLTVHEIRLEQPLSRKKPTPNQLGVQCDGTPGQVILDYRLPVKRLSL